MPTVSEETIQLVANAAVQRAITMGTGLTGYDLEKSSKALVPIQTPLRNRLKRRKGQGAPKHEWRAIYSFDTARITGANTEGGAPSRVTYGVTPMSNSFRTLAIANDVTFEAEWTGVSLEGSSVAKRRRELLWQLMIVEERAVLNNSANLMAPPAPLLSTAATGGTVAAGTTWVQVTSVNANGETTPGTIAKIVTTGTTSTVTITVFTVPNAGYYNVYIGTGATQPTNASMFLQASFSGSGNAPQPGYMVPVALVSGGTTVSGEAQGPTLTFVLTAPAATGTANPPATNTAITQKDSGTGNPQQFDGILAQVINNAAGNLALGTYVAQPAASTGLLALSDLDSALIAMFGQSGADPTTMYVSAIVSKRITAQLIAANILRLNASPDDGKQLADVTAGQRVSRYLNPVTGRLIDIVISRYIPADTVLFASHDLPFPIPDLEAGCELVTNREYWSVDFALTQGQFSFANYCMETPVCYYLGGFGVIRGCMPSY